MKTYFKELVNKKERIVLRILVKIRNAKFKKSLELYKTTDFIRKKRKRNIVNIKVKI